MKVNYIYIDGYKNLNKLEVVFEEDSSVNAIIGNNGSGKSNVIEALTRVFSAIYNDTEVDFTYEIRLTSGEDNIVLSNSREKSFLKNDRPVRKDDRALSMPRTIFLYYCGETDRLKNLALECVDKKFDKALKVDGEVTAKYLSFVGLKEFSAAFLSNAAYHNSTFDKTCELIGIDEVGGPITFYLKRPPWGKTGQINENSFWNARGTVAMLLHSIKDVGTLHVLDRNNAKIVVDSLNKIKIDSENPFDLFIRFELLIQTGILEAIDFVIIKDGNEISPAELSEGEKQLAQFLSLLEATKAYRAVFLLDEFDSFLHPGWQRRFAEIISEIDITGQVLFTTHSPLTLGKMRKENIRIIKDGQVFEPDADTYNRDITEVLEELMEVGKRPVEVERAIRDFRNAVMHHNRKGALACRETLEGLLSEEDPFWVTVKHLLQRLER